MTKDAQQNLSPFRVLLDTVGAVIQEAKHYQNALPPAVAKKLLRLESVSGLAVLDELKRVEVQDEMLAETVDRETVIKMLDLHFNADKPEENRWAIEAQPTEYIIRFFGEMFAVALGSCDAPNFVTTELTLRGRGPDGVTDRYELTIRKLFGLSPREKYDDLLRRTKGFAGQSLIWFRRIAAGQFSSNEPESPYLNDLIWAAEQLEKEEQRAPVAFTEEQKS